MSVSRVGGMTPSELSIRARIGAFALHATHDPRETTARARATFLAKFEDLVDPERVLPEGERLRRAECARKAHFAKLALKSAVTRRKEAEKQRRKQERKAAVDQTAANMEVADGTAASS